MASSMLFPDPRGRSATAAAGLGNVYDDNIYSAVTVAHGGNGAQKAFTVPQGGQIPALKGSAITVAQAHQLTYTELTTNLTQAGQLGAGIGDASVSKIGLQLEQAPANYGTAAQVDPAYGATAWEAMEVANKCYFQFKVAGKVQIQGPTTLFPAMGGVYGYLESGTPVGAFNAAIVNNGPLAVGRKLRVQIPIARTDNLEGVVGVAAGASLAFRTTTGAGAASLLYCVLGAAVKGDVR